MKDAISPDKIISFPRGNSAVKGPGRMRKTIFGTTFCTIMAAIGIFGGISTLFAGLFCAVIYEIGGDAVYNRVGTTLLVMAIPMILVGSIFLDEIRGTNA